VAETTKGRLKRELGVLDVFCISTGAMIGSGLFVLPGLVYAKVGPAAILVYLVAGLFALPALFAKTELATAMPKAGGDYFFIERSMGSVAGTLGGLASWISLSLKSAFALVGMGAFVSMAVPGATEWQIRLVVVGFCAFFTLLNLTSVKMTGRVQVGLVLGLVALLFLYVSSGTLSLSADRYTPFLRGDRWTFFAAVGMVFVSFGGLTKAASVAEEVRHPERNLPYGMMTAFGTVILLYVAAIFVTVGLLDSDALSGSRMPLSDGGAVLFGPAGRALMALAGIAAFVSTANAGILSASRFPMAMSRDRLLPPALAKVSPRFGTPQLAIALTGLFMTAAILFLDFESLVKVASAMKILLFLMVILAGMIMRESRILNYRPAFLTPLYPWVQVAGLAAYGAFLYAMGTPALIATGSFVLIGLLWHRLYVRGRGGRKSGLVHIVERVTNREIAGDSLGTELYDILRERDQMVEDRFDTLVKGCDILDLENATSLEDFFQLAAERLAPSLGTDPKALREELLERERESTTEIRPGLAIPHVIVEGEGRFQLLIARCQPGIPFAPDLPPVYAAFILAGSRDERTFHLRALSAIAQIVEDAEFDHEWLRARNVGELRDLLLLAKRRRE
jgi:amino acid transporter/mannitol/fructose-specific phosphotransferase system IIA component (Ntr-type)